MSNRRGEITYGVRRRSRRARLGEMKLEAKGERLTLLASARNIKALHFAAARRVNSRNQAMQYCRKYQAKQSHQISSIK